MASIFSSSGAQSLSLNSLSQNNPNNSNAVAPQTNPELAGDTVLADPPEDSIADLAFSPQSDLISVASWDSKVRIYEVINGQSQGRAMYEHQAPVLTTRWAPDGTKLVSGGADNAVRLYDVTSGQASQIGVHDQPVKAVRFVDIGGAGGAAGAVGPMLATASWDKTLKYWDLRQPSGTPISTVALPDRAYTMDTAKSLLIVGTAERHVVAIDLRNPQAIFRNSDSVLKWQTRNVACFLSGDGYAISSIEGRCSIQYLDPDINQQNSFSFKCHRKTINSPRAENLVFAVNSMCFHPLYGTLSTAGADGSFNFWDLENRHRLKGFTDVGGPISATAFNSTGTIFAYAVSYDWSKGYQQANQFPNIVKFHPTNDEQVKPKSKVKR